MHQSSSNFHIPLVTPSPGEFDIFNFQFGKFPPLTKNSSQVSNLRGIFGEQIPLPVSLYSCSPGHRVGAVVRALAFQRCVPGSIPGPGVICGLSLLLVLYSGPRGFSSGSPVFPSPQKLTFLNSNSIWIIVKHFIMSSWLGWLRKHTLSLTLYPGYALGEGGPLIYVSRFFCVCVCVFSMVYFSYLRQWSYHNRLWVDSRIHLDQSRIHHPPLIPRFAVYLCTSDPGPSLWNLFSLKINVSNKKIKRCKTRRFRCLYDAIVKVMKIRNTNFGACVIFLFFFHVKN